MWKVVVVDDDRHVLQSMKKNFPWNEIGIEWVGEAADGEEGLEIIGQLNPDIVITDIYMPVMNGLNMIEKLRNDHFQGAILILSGYADFQYAVQALRLKVDDYISKR